jgi:hypothetical protein
MNTSVYLFGISLGIILACIITIIHLALTLKESDRVYYLMKADLDKKRDD